MFKEKAKLMDKDAIERALTRIAHEIIEHQGDMCSIALVGIRNRGEHLARRLVTVIECIKGEKPPLGILDITLYRDDLTDLAQQPIVYETTIDFDISNRHIIPRRPPFARRMWHRHRCAVKNLACEWGCSPTRRPDLVRLRSGQALHCSACRSGRRRASDRRSVYFLADGFSGASRRRPVTREGRSFDHAF